MNDGTNEETVAWGDVAGESAKAGKAKRTSRSVFIAGRKRKLVKDEKIERRSILVALTKDELLEKGRFVAEHAQTIAVIEDQLKTHTKAEKGRIERLKGEQKLALMAISSGQEDRDMDVALIRDDAAGDMVSISLLTGDEVGRRSMTVEERQLGILDFDT